MNPLKNEDGIVYVNVGGKTYKLQSVLRRRERNALRIAWRTMTPYAKVPRFVAAVYANREKGRTLTMRQFCIGQSTYYWRLERYARILGYGGAC